MRHKSGQGITKRGFSRAVRPNQGHEFAFLHGQVDILQNRRIRQRILVGDVLQVYDRHNRRTRVRMTNAIRIDRIILSVPVSGISRKNVFGRVDVKPRASIAMARSSTSTREPNTSGPTSGTIPLTLRTKLLCVSSPRERWAEIMVCALA